MGLLLRIVVVTLLLWMVPAATAQQNKEWEIGGAGGWGFATERTVKNESGSAKAGFQNGVVVSAVAGHAMWKYVSGEIRYVYRKGNPRVVPGSTMTGESHAVGYDILLSPMERDAKVRPFVAFGGGAKVFRGTGQEFETQPGSEFVLLTRTQQTQPMLSFGAGVAIQLAPYAVLRLDFRDHVTPFPKRVLQPAPGAVVGNVLHDFMPMVGIGLVF